MFQARSSRRSRRLPRLLAVLAVLASLLAVAPPAAFAAEPSVVTNCADTVGPATPGSLRAAVEAANADGTATALDPHDITFALDPACDTITLSGTQLELSNHVNVQGPGANVLAVSGNDISRVFDNLTGVTATISGLTIANGNGGFEGGNIRNRGTLTVSQVVITGGVADLSGGIDTGGSGSLTVERSTLSGNKANTGGGAIWTDHAVTITNSTISGNTSEFNAIQADGPSAVVEIVSSTVTGNVAVSPTIGASNLRAIGGGTITLSSSIVSGGIGRDNCLATGGTITSLGHNLEDTNTCGLNPALDDIPNGIPGLGPLDDNGGPTMTHALGPDSDALDAIPAVDCPVATDQRGVDRPQGSACDIGAFEVQPWTINLTLDPPAPDGQDGWYVSDITVTWTITGEMGGDLEGCEDQVIDTDTAGTELTCVVTDPDGVVIYLTITVKRDATAPVVNVPDNITVVAPTSAGVAVTYPPATATDNLSGASDPVCLPPSGSTFLPGAMEVACESTDGAGNAGTNSFFVTVVRDWVQGCLYGGGLSQVSLLAYGALSTATCSRGVPVVLEQGGDYYGCLYAGALSQVGTSAPSSCGRGTLVALAAGKGLWGCLYAGALSQVGASQPGSCGRGERIGLARADAGT